MLVPRVLAAIGLAVLTAAAAAWGQAPTARAAEPASEAGIATTAAPRAGMRLTGLVEPVRSRLVTAPRITGGVITGGGPQPQLVLVRLAKGGAKVRTGDLLVEFDRTAQLKNGRDREADYRDLLSQIEKKRAEQMVARAQRQAGLKMAENAVRRAELDLIGLELLPPITAEKNQQLLEEARAKVAQLRVTSGLHERAAAADLRMLEIRRDRARNAWDHAVANAARMRIVSPLDGLVVLRSVFKGGTMAEMQEGEEVRPGIPILEVVDPGAMRVRATVNQADVGALAMGTKARITLDSYPARTFDGRLENLSPVATTSTMSGRVRTFVAVFSVEGTDEHLLPDLAAAIDVLPGPAGSQ